jgi:hypothetical protein
MQFVTQPMPLSSEVIDDRVATVLDAGENVTLNYDDASNTLIISATPGGGGSTYTDEQAQDAVAAMLTAGTNITLSYNDVANTLTINSTASGGADTETIQDLVAAMLTDTATIDFTYNDTTGVVTADVKNVSITAAKMSIQFSGNILGRGSSGSGAAEELGVAAPLGISGGFLRFTAPGSTGQIQFNNGSALAGGSAIVLNAAGSVINSFYPMTQKGELFTRDSTSFVAHQVGQNTTVLTADSTHANGMRWADLPSRFLLLGA